MFNKYFKIGVSNYYFYDVSNELVCSIDTLTKESIIFTLTGNITLKLTNALIQKDLINDLIHKHTIIKIISKFRAYDFETSKQVNINEIFTHFSINDIEIISEKAGHIADMIISISINGQSEIEVEDIKE